MKIGLFFFLFCTFISFSRNTTDTDVRGMAVPKIKTQIRNVASVKAKIMQQSRE